MTNFQDTELHLLHGLDFKQLLVEIDQMDLPYRDHLNLPQTATFGIEIEFEKAYLECVRFLVKEFQYSQKKYRHVPQWKTKIETSITNIYYQGGEIISPRSTDEKLF